MCASIHKAHKYFSMSIFFIYIQTLVVYYCFYIFAIFHIAIFNFRLLVSTTLVIRLSLGIAYIYILYILNAQFVLSVATIRLK